MPYRCAVWGGYMYSWRITKYNPEIRDEHGYYGKDEWIMMRDIGKDINGEILSIDEYLRVEDLYIGAVLEFQKCNNIDKFTASDVGRFRFRNQKIKPSKNMKKLYKKVKENDIIGASDLLDIIRLNLRALLNCNLLYEDDMFVHFGWDYYMYIGSKQKCDNAIKQIEESGLFVEEFESPYLNTVEDEL